MKIAITGSRSITDEAWIEKQMKASSKDFMCNTVWLAGGAEGVDKISAEVARKYSADVVLFLPYYKLDKTEDFKTKHFFTRNRQLVHNADLVLAL